MYSHEDLVHNQRFMYTYDLTGRLVRQSINKAFKNRRRQSFKGEAAKAIKYYSKSTAAYRKAVKNYIHDELNFKEIAKRAGNRFFKWLGW